ncbi:hypothetical protein, partial [Anaerobiospirillum succiniciproducens]|uniref:hypothetical protein n=1 Tax=Anaerobiospirillum succiniciproducens TaxID=13335 RepID=UPI003F8CBBE8
PSPGLALGLGRRAQLLPMTYFDLTQNLTQSLIGFFSKLFVDYVTKGLGELQVSREDMEGWAERVVREQFTH